MPLLENQVHQSGTMKGMCVQMQETCLSSHCRHVHWEQEMEKSPFLGKRQIDNVKKTITKIASKYYKLELPSWKSLQGWMVGSQPRYLGDDTMPALPWVHRSWRKFPCLYKMSPGQTKRKGQISLMRQNSVWRRVTMVKALLLLHSIPQLHSRFPFHMPFIPGHPPWHLAVHYHRFHWLHTILYSGKNTELVAADSKLKSRHWLHKEGSLNRSLTLEFQFPHLRRFVGELSEITSESQPAHTLNEWYQLLHIVVIVVFLPILKCHKSLIAEMSEGDEEG